MPLTIAEALQQATDKFKLVSDSARLDAEVLLAHSMQKDRAYFLTWPEKSLAPPTQQQFLDMVARRAQGEPVAYIIGVQGFWSLQLNVTADTLIPRPETECLVEEALTLIAAEARLQIVDLGTGTGAIALAIGHERPLCHVIGVDQSPRAVAVAHENASRLDIRNVTFQQGDWLAGFADHSLDMIVSNPPYVAEHDPHLSQGDVRFEPQPALIAGPEGLDAYKKILPEAKRCLKPQGWLLLEHGYEQQDRLLELLQVHGFMEARGISDYSGQPRVVVAHT